MKKIIWFCILLLIVGTEWLHAQVAINTDASLPNASAMLEIKTNNKGFLGPRLTSAQRIGIASPADGLWVYDTDTKTFWFYKGSAWVEIVIGSGSSFVLPYSASQGYTGSLFSLTNSSSGSVASFSSTSTSSTQNIFSVKAVGPGVIADHSIGNAGNFFMNNTNGVGAGVRGEVNSIFGNNGTAGVYGLSSGSGGYGGYFEHTNATGFGTTLYASTNGQGIVAAFETVPTANTKPTITANTAGLGSVASFGATNASNTANTLNVTAIGQGVIADHSQGNAGNFFMNNTNGVGAGIRGEVNSIFGNNGTAGVYGVASGSGGYGGYFEHSSTTGYGYALLATTQGLGPAVQVLGNNSGSLANIVSVVSNGPGVIADHSQGNAGNFFINNQNGVGAGVRGETNSIFGNSGAAGVYGVASGTGGYAGYFDHTEKTGYGVSVSVNTQGLGTALEAVGNNASSTANIVSVTSNGGGVIANHSLGNAANFFINNQNGVGAAVRGETNSIFGNSGAAGIYGVASGTGGYAGYFDHTEKTGYGVSLSVNTQGLGTAFEAVGQNASSLANIVNVTSIGPGVIPDHSRGNAGNFVANNTNGVGAGVRGEVNSIFGNNGTAGVYGVASGTGGYAGYFEHTEKTGYGIALQVVTNDIGTAMVVDHEGTSGNLAIFQAAGANKIRFDHTGKGFFNNGTQNSGADLAEAFDVTGTTNAYEPGDVLAIAVDADRTVQKSKEAYSSLVVGVYATKPGVLLTEENVDSNLNDKVPMGVVGVIPTKVCDENGPIRRGDILVSATRPGYAMKADLNKLKPGQAIGKALQEFDGETGKIKVLVNVR